MWCDGAVTPSRSWDFWSIFWLPNCDPGKCLILDNLPAHKSLELERQVESKGARVMSLPPYSPDYNPIKLAISKVKSILRKLAARSVDGLINAIGQSLSSITVTDAINPIQYSGYCATDAGKTL